jgi:hypothetical protein
MFRMKKPRASLPSSHRKRSVGDPIEECFLFVKHWIRRHGQEFRNILEMGDEAEPYLFLYNALDHTLDASRGGFGIQDISKITGCILCNNC